jgi:hypothetical protein
MPGKKHVIVSTVYWSFEAKATAEEKDDMTGRTRRRDQRDAHLRQASTLLLLDLGLHVREVAADEELHRDHLVFRREGHRQGKGYVEQDKSRERRPSPSLLLSLRQPYEPHMMRETM